MLLMYGVKATGTLRVSKEGELEGLDVHEHGGTAYPELLAGSTGIPDARSGATHAALTTAVAVDR
jgi:Amt family ammonium transporter